MLRFSLLLAALAATVGIAQPAPAQSPSNRSYEPDRVWSRPSPFDRPSAYRTGSGRPGPDYWQNRVDYTIHATLDTSKKTIEGEVQISYTNNSPSALRALWLELESLYRQPTGTSITPSVSSTGHGALFNIGRVARIEPKPTTALPTSRVDGRLQIQLANALDAFGGKMTVTVEYVVSLSKDRLPLHHTSPDGPLYQIANWYPRVATYDALHGWTGTTKAYNGPVQSEYASVDYYLTVPATMIVAGSGTLMNAKDVLTADQRRRLLSARRSKRKVAVISPDRAGRSATRPQEDGVLTWHFRMNGTRDAAWAASPSFVWNAARIKRPEMNAGLAMSFYPPSAVSGEGWNRSTYHAQKSTQLFSSRLKAYPWNNAINVAAPIGKKGFPGITFCEADASGAALFRCTVRGQAQHWFPRIVSADPQRYPWMHAGFTTFLSRLAHQELYDGEFASTPPFGAAPTRTGAPAPQDPISGHESATIMTPAGRVNASQHASLYGIKTAIGLLLLREYILKPEQFDRALRAFVRRWAYRRPTPEDFFRTVNDATGQDLWWFWRGWFTKPWTCDQRIADVSYVDGDPSNGANITVELRKPLPMPAELRITDAGGDAHRIRLPVEVWQAGAQHTVTTNTTSELKKVVLDPDDELPDVSPSNDTWTRKR